MISNLTPSGDAFVANMNRVQRRMEKATQETTSGLRVNSPSDAPEEVVAILQIRTDSARNQQIASNLGLAKTDADAADSALTEAAKLLDRARALGAQGANYTLDAAGRTSIASEIEGILEQMVSISRTSVQGRYIFGGDDDGNPPYQLDLGAATGVDRLTTAPATRRLEDPAGGSFPVAKTAGEIFDARNPDDSPSTSNVFVALSAMRTALLNNDVPGINGAIGLIQTAGIHLGVSQGFYGNVLSRIEDATNYGQSYDVQLKTQLSQKVDADITQAAMMLTQSNTQLQAAFQMQARMPHTSLFDFLG